MNKYFYEEEFKLLNKHKIKYLVIGGVAVNLYGLHRMTMDLDLLIDLSEDRFGKFAETIKTLGYKTKVPKDQWTKVNAIAFHTPKEKDKRIDVFLKNPIDFDPAYKRRKVFRVDGFSISCVSLLDLLILKNKANRVRDWIDIGSLKRMKKLKNRK